MSVSPGSQPTHSGSVHSSNDSMHDADADIDGRAQALPQPQKRKGGRKPIYATSEERKQRNRQAQAAFRERRTEYIKQLEIQIKQNEETMASLRLSHRSAADECHLLRYQNSLLERILVEKGFDVQAELHSRGSSPAQRPQHASPASPGAPIMQQAIMNRHQQARRPTSNAPVQHEPEFQTPPIQSLRISPGASGHLHTPSSSSFSSPAMNLNGMSVTDGRTGNQTPQPTHVQHSQHGQPMLSQQYNYQPFSSVPGQSPGNVSSHHTEANDPSKYGHAGFTGYHTPSSMDDVQRSRNSSMAQTAMTSLGKLAPSPLASYIDSVSTDSERERESQYHAASVHNVDQPSSSLNYYSMQMPPYGLQSQSGQQQQQQHPPSFGSQRPPDFMSTHASIGYPSHMYGENYQGMITSNRYSHEDEYSLATCMQYPNHFIIDATSLR